MKTPSGSRVFNGDYPGRYRVIAVTNEKGGVAKTTTVLSLGGALVESGYEVLLIDLDAQANLTLGLGVNPLGVNTPVANPPGISDVLLNSASLVNASRETSLPGMRLVPSNSDLVMAERFLPVRQDYEHILANAITTAIYHSDQSDRFFNTKRSDRVAYILLDCPPSLGAITINALAAAHLAIIPTQPEYFSVNGLRGVLAIIRRLRNQVNPSLNYRVLITMMDRRNRIHHTLNDQLRATFGEGVLNTVIEVDTRLRESSIAGLPVTHYAPRTRSAGQYRSLAQELIWSEANVQERIAQST